jgi:hypothetical protein
MPTEIFPTSRITKTKDQVSCDLGDEAVVLECVRGTYYGMNPVAATVWKALKEPRSVAELRDIVLGEYEVEPERCEGELFKLLQDMAAAGLIEISQTPA